jgi:hypothetical protein
LRLDASVDFRAQDLEQLPRFVGWRITLIALAPLLGVVARGGQVGLLHLQQGLKLGEPRAQGTDVSLPAGGISLRKAFASLVRVHGERDHGAASEKPAHAGQPNALPPSPSIIAQAQRHRPPLASRAD